MAPFPIHIGPYRLERYLGAGGTGEVYLAWDEQLERHVAVKRLRPALAAEAWARERLGRLASVAAALDHPAIVRIHALVADGDGDALVMEFVEGRSLALALRTGTLGAEVALGLAAEIAEGLAAAHAQRVVHGDLRPENVMITASGHAKILNFGAGRQLGFEAHPDLVAMGLLIHEILEAGTPGGGARLRRLAMPPGLEADAAEHLAGAEEVARAWRAFGAAGSPVMAVMATTACPPGQVAAPRAGSQAWRRRAGLAVAGAAILLAAALSIWRSGGASPLRVAVARPAIVEGAAVAEIDSVGLALRTAILHALNAFDGVFPLPPEPMDAARGSPLARARALAADEVATALLSCHPETCEVTLSRVAAKDGSLIWTQSLQVPTRQPRLVAAAVERHIADAYRGYRWRTGAQRLTVRPQDFGEYLALLGSLERAGAGGPLDAELSRVEAIRANSPAFAEGALLEAALLRRRFALGRDRTDLDRAIDVLAQAGRRSPADPRLPGELFETALAGERRDQAQAALDALARLRPGDPTIPARRTRLGAGRGEG